MSMSYYDQQRLEAQARGRARRQAVTEGLPPYPRDPRGVLIERKLDERHAELVGAVESLDRLLDEVAEEFAEAFARDDARAATRARLSAATQSGRNQAARNRRIG